MKLTNQQWATRILDLGWLWHGLLFMLNFNLNFFVLFHLPVAVLFQCSSHTFPGGPDQRRAGGPGAAGIWGAPWTRRRLWGRSPGWAAEEASRAKSPDHSQQIPQTRAAQVRVELALMEARTVFRPCRSGMRNTNIINVGFTAASQVGKRGDAQTRSEAEGAGGWQRGDGGIQANHGGQAEETHSNQEGEGPGLEGTEGEGKHPQASGRLRGEMKRFK